LTRAASNEPTSVAEQELQDRQVVLELLLHSYPAALTDEEIILELGHDPQRFADRDRIIISLRDLVAHGLLHRHGTFYFPTRAAIHAAYLLAT
jgi:hypothetical protein